MTTGNVPERWRFNRPIPRRAILRAGIATGALGIVDSIFEGIPGAGRVMDFFEELIVNGDPLDVKQTWAFTLRRREDMLRLDFRFYNLKLKSGKLEREAKDKHGVMVVDFGPQHLAEQTAQRPFQVTTEGPGTIKDADLLTPLEHRLANASRLAFRTSNGQLSIPFNLAGLLSWQGLLPVVSPLALTRADVLPAKLMPLTVDYPKDIETAIEVPYRVVMSSTKRAWWSHRVVPNTVAGRTDLWNTRLGVASEIGTEEVDLLDEQIVRAVYARDADGPDISWGKEPPNLTFALSKADRLNLAQSSSGNRLSPEGPPDPNYLPEPITARKLVLSALGAWADFDVRFRTGALQSGTSLLTFKLQAMLGRDAYVNVVNVGYLMPFGHRALKVTVSQRQVVNENAYLVRTDVVIPLERTRSFVSQADPTLALAPFTGRMNPFDKVTLGFAITPLLKPETDAASVLHPDIPTFRAFVLQTGKPLRLPVEATDAKGRVHDLAIQMVFVSQVAAEAQGTNAGQPVEIGSAYSARGDLTTVNASGEIYGYAADPAGQSGVTELVTKSLRLGAVGRLASPNPLFAQLNRPAFYPVVQSAEVKLPGADRFGAAATGWKQVEFDPKFLSDEFTANNKAKLLLRLKGDSPPLKFPLARTGALVKPDFDITAYSTSLGLVGGRDALVASGEINPADFFASSSKFLGLIELRDLVAPVAVTELKYALRTSERKLPGGATETTLTWAPKLKASKYLTLRAGAALTLTAVYRVDPADPQATTSKVSAELNNVTLHLLDGTASGPTHFLAIDVERFHSLSESGQDPKFTAEIGNIEFLGALKFVKALSDFLSGGDAPDVRVTSAGIEVRSGFTLPDLDMGVFTLRNLSFSTALAIPFSDGVLALRFAVASASNPFVLSVSLFGGGGYLAMELTSAGVTRFMVALEFGAHFSLDIGVASGGVYLKASVQIEILKDREGNSSLSLGGRLTMGGELDVMGVITASITFDMGLTYRELTVGGKKVDKIRGHASLTIEIDVALFSGSVTLAVTRSFGNAPQDPSFRDVVDPDRWVSYCEAFDPLPIGSV